VRFAEVVAEVLLYAIARNGFDVLVTAHADVAMEPPHRQDDLVATERAIPRKCVLVVRVDERSVEVEERRPAQLAVASAETR